jgi:hypothetical protein
MQRNWFQRGTPFMKTKEQGGMIMIRHKNFRLAKSNDAGSGEMSLRVSHKQSHRLIRSAPGNITGSVQRVNHDPVPGLALVIARIPRPHSLFFDTDINRTIVKCMRQAVMGYSGPDVVNFPVGVMRFSAQFRQ